MFNLSGSDLNKAVGRTLELLVLTPRFKDAGLYANTQISCQTYMQL
jgi:hypothetical protein